MLILGVLEGGKTKNQTEVPLGEFGEGMAAQAAAEGHTDTQTGTR